MIERREITDRASWLEWRKTFLTASDLGAVAGKDPYKSALRVWNEKQGLIPDQADNEAMKRGRWLEAAAIEGLKEEHPDWLITRPKLFLADTVTRLGATPDAFITRPGSRGVVNCQIKCTGPIAFDRHWSDGVPPGYALQTVCEGMLLGAETNFVCALVVDSHKATIALYELPRHPGVEEQIEDMAMDFWDRVDTGRPYPPDYARDADVIKAMYPAPEPGSVRDLSGDNRLAELLPTRAMFKKEISGMEEQVKAIDTEIEAKMGRYEVAEIPGWRLTWKTVSRKAYTVAERSGRELRIKALKEDGA
jgi:putative phage-type endonuclease